MKMKYRRRIATMILAWGVILTALSGYVFAKYVKVVPFEEKVTIRAEIGTLVLQEHKVERRPDGSYTLLTGNENLVLSGPGTANAYTLIPGLDVPKDPHVVITKPNNLPVYVYVEVVSKLPSTITFELADGWTKVDGVTAPNGGTVYAYNTAITADETIHILKKDGNGNSIFVSQKLLSGDTTGIELDFYAYMYQTAAGGNVAEVFKHYN